MSRVAEVHAGRACKRAARTCGEQADRPDDAHDRPERVPEVLARVLQADLGGLVRAEEAAREHGQHAQVDDQRDQQRGRRLDAEVGQRLALARVVAAVKFPARRQLQRR